MLSSYKDVPRSKSGDRLLLSHTWTIVSASIALWLNSFLTMISSWISLIPFWLDLHEFVAKHHFEGDFILTEEFLRMKCFFLLFFLHFASMYAALVVVVRPVESTTAVKVLIFLILGRRSFQRRLLSLQESDIILSPYIG